MSIFKRKPVAVLGSGPAGIFAAHAAREAGYSVRIFSARSQPSFLNGAQYLHAPIPGLTVDTDLGVAKIEYNLQGTALGYATKVYGPERGPSMAGEVSPAKMSGTHEAWEIRQAYREGWVNCQKFDAFWKADINDAAMMDMCESKEFTKIISTIPPTAFCRFPGMHVFNSAKIWAKGDAPELNLYCPVRVGAMTVQCNGEPSPGWYRAANVFSYKTAEWPGTRRPPINDVALVQKPLSTNCDCFAGGRVLRVGRYGTWTKGQLSHSAYYATREALS